MEDLASCAMAEFRVERRLSAELVLDLPAVAAGGVEGVEVLVRVVDFVRGAEFPFVL